MSKMKEYDIYVPISYNDGLPIEEFKLDKLQHDLLESFAGVSVTMEPICGYWKGPNEVYKNFNYVYKVVAEDSEAARSVILELKAALEKSLKQEQIFIIVRDVEVM